MSESHEENAVDAEVVEEPPFPSEVSSEPPQLVVGVPLQSNRIIPRRLKRPSDDWLLSDIDDLKYLRYSLFGGFALLCLVGNLFVPGLFWDRSRFGSWSDTVGCFAGGALAAEIGILAVWLALGTQALRWRFLATSLLSVFAAGSYILGLQIPELTRRSSNGMPIWVAIVILAIAILGMLAASGVLVFVGRLLRERIVQRDHESEVSGDRSYSIAYLIALTTFIAVAIAILRAVMPEGSGRVPGGEVLFLVFFIVQTTALICIILSACTMLVLRARNNWQGAIWLAGGIFFCIPANLFLMSYYRQIRMDAEVIVMNIAFCMGFTFSMLVFLAAMRLAGYKLDSVA